MTETVFHKSYHKFYYFRRRNKLCRFDIFMRFLATCRCSTFEVRQNNTIDSYKILTRIPDGTKTCQNFHKEYTIYFLAAIWYNTYFYLSINGNLYFKENQCKKVGLLKQISACWIWIWNFCINEPICRIIEPSIWKNQLISTECIMKTAIILRSTFKYFIYQVQVFHLSRLH